MGSWKPFVGAVAIFAALSPAVTLGEGQELRITEMAVTTKIVKGSPVDSVACISTESVKALYCFTRVESDSDADGLIRHVWLRDGEKVGEYTLPVRGRQWRTYSKKLIERGWGGNWRVEARDRDGNLLVARDFRMN